MRSPRSVLLPPRSTPCLGRATPIDAAQPSERRPPNGSAPPCGWAGPTSVALQMPPAPVLRPQLPPSHVCGPPAPTTDPPPPAPLDPFCRLHTLLAHYGHAVLVANYTRWPFAPGRDPRVCLSASLGFPACPAELRAASMAATSSIHPVKGRIPCVPFETEPLIGSESRSIASSRCAVALSTAGMLTARSVLRPRKPPQD